MAIIVKLDDVLHARRMTLTELSGKVDITLANLSILKTGKARAIRFSTLDAICRALDCQPGDLLEYAAKDASTATDADDPEHPPHATPHRESR
jgi:putative transcriptional regulator